jgi:tetratricopeptide (TPR) repeat protein
MKLVRSKAWLVPVGVLFSFAVSCPVFAQQTQVQKQEIYRLLAAQRFQEAEQAATTYLATTPGDCGVRVMLGIALRGEAKLEPALKVFEAAMKQCPESLAALEGTAETAFLLNRPEAKSLVEQVIKLRPADETGYAMLGAIDARAGDCAGAVENYVKAPSQVRTNVAALGQYGGCLLALDRTGEAVSTLQQLLSLKDDRANRLALARAQERAGDHKSALGTLQPLLGAESKDGAALRLGAQIAEADNDTPQAIAWLRRAIEINPKDVDAYLIFSEISFNHASFKVGMDFINLGIQQLPSEARLYLARGVMEVQTSHTDEALRDFEQAHRLDPKLAFAQDAQGMLLSQKHDSASALKVFEEQSRIHADDALVQYLYAEALSEAATDADPSLSQKALEVAKRAVKLEPGYQPARDLLCTLLLRHNDLDAAVEQAEEALRREPFDEVALYQEMLAQHKLKHAEKAQALVKRLQEAKIHNQQTTTRYVLDEAKPGASSKD